MGYDELRSEFESPGAGLRSMPFWMWNDDLKADELVRQIKEFKVQGMGGFFIHSREGLEIEYLGEKWMELVKTVVAAAKEEGMEAWLYDEDRWPSGYAGGKVPGGGDEFRCKGLTMEVTDEFAVDEDVVAAYIVEIDPDDRMKAVGFERVDCFVADAPRNDGGVGRKAIGAQEYTAPRVLKANERYVFLRIEVSGKDDWFNGEAPPDNLNPAAVRRFIDVTHEKYKEKVGGDFGSVVKGIFTDEPGLHDTHTKMHPERGWIPWTYKFAEYFRQKRGYDPFDLIPLVYFNGDGMEAIRHDYWRTVMELFVESFSKQLGDWCGENGIAFTGHYLQENRLGLGARVAGAIMPHYVHQQVPGIDLLTEQCVEYMTVRQCTSVANQFSRPQVITETYGCTGWGFTFEGQRWIGDWQFVQGVTRRCQHLALYSIKGCRKRDYPPVFGYNTTWWKHNHVVEDYFARLSAVLTKGKPVRDILVLHPASTAWSELGTSPYGTPRRRDERDTAAVDKWGHKLTALMKHLMGMHYDFDLGDETILSAEGKVDGGKFWVKDCVYKVLVIPEIKTMLKSTVDILLKFLDAGGYVTALDTDATPVSKIQVEGRVNAGIQKLLEHKKFKSIKCHSMLDFMLDIDAQAKHVKIQSIFEQEETDVYYMLREIDEDTNLLFVVNHNRS